MSLERTAIVQAVNSTNNLDEAAEKLGASRRTLQNHMRDLGLPRGRAGRPRHELPFSSEHSGVATGLLVLGGFGTALFFAHKWLSSRSPDVVGESTATYLLGINAVL